MAFRSRRRADMSVAVTEGTRKLERLVQDQLEALGQLQATVVESVADTRREMDRREVDLLQVLELVSEVCRHAIDVIEAERDEHHAFLASLAEIVRPVTAVSTSQNAVDAPSATVLGGTVIVDPVDIDLGEIEDSESRVPAAATDEPEAHDAPADAELPFR